ncbi:FAD-dependent oxidoreductase [Streptomyces sp. NPDC017405]|uniref:FAD-dependent oxidoreductase n=1 Tax=unclassified Streptomyces TaxID=2593676 RepID=UPI0037BA12EE
MRLGIAGGGIAGLTLAWLLDGSHEVLLLEERPRLGGNADSVLTTADGRTHVVDLGVRETPAEVSPVWRHIAAMAGLPGEDLVPVTASRTVFEHQGGAALCVSPAEPAGPARHVSPAAPAGAARQVTAEGPVHEAVVRFAEESSRWATEGLSWEVTLGDVLDAWDLQPSPAERLLCALPASLHGVTLGEARGLSARAVGATFTRPDRTARTTYLRSGTGALVQRLAAGARSATVRLGTGLRAVRRAADGFALVQDTGAVDRVDAVALALPADRAGAVIGGLARADAWRAALAAVEYRDVTYVLHRDPYGMPGDRSLWSTANTTLDGNRSETTTWYGPSLGLDLFVSQLDHRSGRPRAELARSSFRATLPTPRASLARQTLGAVGEGQRLFFLGHCATPVETQEAAMTSALAVAHHLAPRSARVRRLRHYLQGG